MLQKNNYIYIYIYIKEKLMLKQRIARIFSGSLFHAIDKRNKGDLLKEDPDCGRTIEQGRRGIWEGCK